MSRVQEKAPRRYTAPVPEQVRFIVERAVDALRAELEELLGRDATTAPAVVIVPTTVTQDATVFGVWTQMHLVMTTEAARHG